MLWDTNKDLSNELKSKEGTISSKNVEIQGLRAKVTILTEEVNGLKYRLTLIDENAVERLRNAKNAETARADKAECELHSLRSTYQNLLGKWYALWNGPEYNEAARKVKERKEHEARLAAEKQDRYQTFSIVSLKKDELPSEHSHFQIERTSTTKRLHPSTTASWLLHIRWN